MFKDAVALVAEDLQVTQKEARRVINSTLSALVQTAKESEKEAVAVRGFGTLKISHVESREGKNPATGEAMTIEAYSRFAVKPAQRLKDFINGKTDTYDLNEVIEEEEVVATKKAAPKKVAPKKTAPTKTAPKKVAPKKKLKK